MTRLTKANRAQLEQNLCELNRELAHARAGHDEESIAILEAQDKIRVVGQPGNGKPSVGLATLNRC